MPEYVRVRPANAGDEVILTVEKVTYNAKSEKIKYPDFTICGRDARGPIFVNIPEVACRRQFSRLKMEPEASVGATIRVSRGANAGDPSKPYWNVEIVNAGDATPQPSKRLPSPSASGDLPGDPASAYNAPEAIDYPVAGREPGEEESQNGDFLRDEAEQAVADRNAQIRRVVKLGLALWDQVAAHQVAAGKADNYPVDAASISRFASTLFIEMNHRGLLR